MKLVILLGVIFFITIIAYIISAKLFKKHKKDRWKPYTAAGTVALVLISLLFYGMYQAEIQPDVQCGTAHAVSETPPAQLETAVDYYLQGNYDYETGNCQKAIEDYTKALSINPHYAQVYNNRAYTNMRLRNYQDALTDLDTAIALKPDYVHALMNRGDIHNFYFAIDRQAAINDYKSVIAITGPTNGVTNVCGHLFLAKHNGWTLGAFIDFFKGGFGTCK